MGQGPRCRTPDAASRTGYDRRPAPQPGVSIESMEMLGVHHARSCSHQLRDTACRSRRRVGTVAGGAGSALPRQAKTVASPDSPYPRLFLTSESRLSRYRDTRSAVECCVQSCVPVACVGRSDPADGDCTRGETPMSEQGFQVDCSGMAHSTPPDPCVVVIFGVAGDLGRTTLVPSLYALACQKLLPEPCAILGVARRDWDDDDLSRTRCGSGLRTARTSATSTWQQFASCLYFVGGDFDARLGDLYDLASTTQRSSRLPSISPTMSCFI